MKHRTQLHPASLRQSITLAMIILAACSGTSNETRDGREGAVTTPPGIPAAGSTGNTPAVETAQSAWTAGVADGTHRIAEAAILNGIRFARHDAFDRIVFEFAGPDIPSYHIEYIDQPVRACGSGDVVPLPGAAWLAVRLEPAHAHNEEGRPTIPARAFTPGLPNLVELRAICDFEAVVEWVGAVRTPATYRVLELRSPARLVVDLRHQ